MGRFRFNLRTVFILATVAVALCGYSQLRRQNIREECRLLEEEGVGITLPNDFRDHAWQRGPIAIVSMKFEDEKRLELIRRLRAINAEQIIAVWSPVK